MNYPKEPSQAHKKAAKEFQESLALLIPCPMCREHYTEHLKKTPITPHLDRREDLFRWTVNLHNEVNIMLGKPTVLESEAIEFYRRLGQRGRSPVMQKEDFEEIDLRSMVKGGILGAAFVGSAAALLWWFHKGEK